MQEIADPWPFLHELEEWRSFVDDLIEFACGLAAAKLDLLLPSR